MESKETGIKLAAAAFLGGAGEALGWKGVMLLMLAAAMCLDYISGTLAAKKNGEWSSKVAREGLFHKGGIILVTSGALIADVLFLVAIPHIPVFGGIDNPGVFLPLVLAWYIITELGSIMENAGKMGAPLPAWFKKAIAAAGNGMDKAGDAITEGDKHD